MDRTPVGQNFLPIQTGPGAHPASCKVGTGSFPGVKYGRGVTLTTHPLLVPWSWKIRAIPLPTLWYHSKACNGEPLHLHFYKGRRPWTASYVMSDSKYPRLLPHTRYFVTLFTVVARYISSYSSSNTKSIPLFASWCHSSVHRTPWPSAPTLDTRNLRSWYATDSRHWPSSAVTEDSFLVSFNVTQVCQRCLRLSQY